MAFICTHYLKTEPWVPLLGWKPRGEATKQSASNDRSWAVCNHAIGLYGSQPRNSCFFD